MRPLLLALLLAAAAVSVHGICDTYTVQAGDSISTIAAQFNVNEGDLQTALTQCIRGYSPGVFLQPNQKICLPTWYGACAYVKVAGGEGHGFDECKYYTVQAGDTLESIALSLGLNRLDLEAVNSATTMLQVNDFVKLPGWYDGCPAPGDAQPCRFYRAQASDSLSVVAIAFSVNLTELVAANSDLASGGTSTVLQPGQPVHIPPFDSSCGEGVEVQKPASGNCNAYVVQTGDTLYSIATGFQTTTQQLLDINPALAAGGIMSVGSELYIPPYIADACAAGVNYVQMPQVQQWSLLTTPVPAPARRLRFV